MQCATLQITNDFKVDEHDYEKEDESPTLAILQPKTPTSLYHKQLTETLGNGIENCKLGAGCIDGLPCELKLSETESFLTNVSVTGLGTEMETVISIPNESNFKPGSIVIYETWPSNELLESKECEIPLEQLKKQLGLTSIYRAIPLMTKVSSPLSTSGLPWSKEYFPHDLLDAVKNLNLLDLNVVLYRCENEDIDSIKDGLYDVPNLGKFAYGGIYGLVPVLLQICRTDNMGHPLFENLRQGPWLINYVTARLEKYINVGYQNLTPLHKWLVSKFDMIKSLPSPLIPKYFAVTVLLAYNSIKSHALFSMKETRLHQKQKLESSFDSFASACYLTTFQFYGSVNSAGLIPKPFTQPLMYKNQPTPVSTHNNIKIGSMAAGLPHFSTNYARVWGRDVFIAFRGLFLIPGYFEAARSHLLAFASTLKHGLLPNLLDEGRYPRYNARDAVWFWVSAMIDYCSESPEGLDFLDAIVPRRFVPNLNYRSNQFAASEEFPEDIFHEYDDPIVYKFTNTVGEILHEIMERHYNGIKFREWNAGEKLDHCMKSEGFNIEINVNENGYLIGGNIHNCGTWMDKMGDSEQSGNRGVPSTPREGSPIEITGLVKKSLSFITNLLDKNDQKWKFTKVERHGGSSISYKDWNQKLQQNFESDYFISDVGYYKDTINAQKKYQETQLRPNQVVALLQVLILIGARIIQRSKCSQSIIKY